MTAADRPSVTRDGMDPLTRAVSDTLDEYLSRHHGILTSHTNPEDFLTWLRENGHEVRPSATDNTRAEGGVIKVPEGEGERFGDALVADALRTHARAEADRKAREEHWCGDPAVFVAGAEWAAGRIEATR